MRPERFTASLFSSYDGLLIFGESLISASGDALAADRVSGPERPHPAIPSPRRTAFHPTEPIPTGIANDKCGADSVVPRAVTERRLSDSKSGHWRRPGLLRQALNEDVAEPIVDNDALLRGVLNELQNLAGKRNLDRFDPTIE